MSNEKDEDDATKWFYDGKEEDWDMFDRKMIRHMIKNYDEFGENFERIAFAIVPVEVRYPNRIVGIALLL
jgi:hypothetical protein